MDLFLGKTVTVADAKTDKSGKVIRPKTYKVSKKDYLDILEGKGIPRDVIKKYDEAINDVTVDAIAALENEFATGDKKLPAVGIEVGSGNGSLAFTMTKEAEVVVRDPKTGTSKQVTRYGQFRMTQRRKMPAAIKSGPLQEAQARIEKKFK